MQVQGKLKVIGQTQELGRNGFLKREVVVTTEEQYPQDIQIEFYQDKCKILDKYAVGQNVTIGINLRGRMWVNPQGEEKYFNSIQGWKIEALKSESEPQAQTFEPDQNTDDDLPF